MLNTYPIGKIVVWGREDYVLATPPEWPSDGLCYRLSDYNVSVLDETGQAVWLQHTADCPRYSTTYNLPHNVSGRFVVIQAKNTDYLNMAEVQVFAPTSIPLVINVVPKKMNTKSEGRVPVVIFASETFDVGSIDTTSLTFGATGDEQSLSHCDYGQDVDFDGYADLVCHFNKTLTGFIAGSGETTAFLKGNLLDGSLFEGNDAVWIIK